MIGVREFEHDPILPEDIACPREVWGADVWAGVITGGALIAVCVVFVAVALTVR